MPEGPKGLVHRWFRIPEEPEPPAGDPASLRVFRAAPAFFRYRLIGWGIGQLVTLVGLTFGLLIGLGAAVEWLEGGPVTAAVVVLGILAWLGFLSLVPLGYVALRLDYELRWYMLSDRALRIREGILTVREKTMTFANIQQISVRQGPLQRLLGIADVEVRTAGGGSSGEPSGDDMHRGYFRGVADAESVRDTIRDRVREYLDSGLGDREPPRGGGLGRPGPGRPGEAPEAVSVPAAGGRPGELRAAREVLAEVRSLGAQLLAGGPGREGRDRASD